MHPLMSKHSCMRITDVRLPGTASVSVNHIRLKLVHRALDVRWAKLLPNTDAALQTLSKIRLVVTTEVQQAPLGTSVGHRQFEDLKREGCAALAGTDVNDMRLLLSWVVSNAAATGGPAAHALSRSHWTFCLF